jgi:hypothetical protein
LTSARWTFPELLEFDRVAQAADQHGHEIGPECVPSVRPGVASFESHFLYDGSTVERVPDSVRYLVTRRNSLIILRGPSAVVVGALNGTRGIREIVDAINRPDQADRFEEGQVADFLRDLSDAGMVAWSK